MMRLLASLLLLLACASVAWADTVLVTTLVDEDNVVNGGTDHGCSLREAVRYMTLPTAQRADGYGGCVKLASGSAATDTVDLPTASQLGNATSYQLTLGEIPLATSITITGTDKTGASVTATADYPVIQAQAGHRIFALVSSPVIPLDPGANSSTQPSSSTVTLSYLVLHGCGSACAVNGGIIAMQAASALSLSNDFLSGGAASSFGGAVYVSPASSLTVSNSEFTDNSASNGAAIAVGISGTNYTATLNVASSVFTGNVATAPASAPGATISLAVPVSNVTLTYSAGSRNIDSSTISGNTGLGLQVLGQTVLGNLTVVENTAGGIDFRNSNTTQLNNSIVAGNPDLSMVSGNPPANDCVNASPPSNPNYVGHNLFSTENCLAELDSQNANGNQLIQIGTPDSQGNLPAGTTQLLSGTNLDGSCPAVGHYPTGTFTGSLAGLLCPPAPVTGPTDTLPFYKPRLPALGTVSSGSFLPNTVSQDEGFNLLVNRGAPTSSAYPCIAADQRGLSQRPNGCDVGSVAVQAKANVSLALTTNIGQVVSGDFVSLLGDVDLLPANWCVIQVGSGSQDGCYKQLPQNLPGKGSFYIDRQTNKVVYTPGSDFYGEDQFSFLVATSLSRFSDLNTDPVQGQFVQVNVTVQTQTVGNPASTKVSTGAFPGLPLLGLGGLMVLRHLRRCRGSGARNV